MAYTRTDVWVDASTDTLGDYHTGGPGSARATVARPASRRIARSNVDAPRTHGDLPATSAAGTAVVTLRRIWVARDGVGTWPRPCVCVEEATDLEAALAGVADDHPAWRP